MSEQTTPPEIGPESPGRISSDEARPLPYSAYPRARDVSQHGIQPLPASLPLVDFARAAPHRSTRYSTVVAPDLTPAQMLQMAWVIAAGFARREPQARHLRPPKHPPAGLMEVRHTDPFGTDSFGSWDTETQMYWIVRLTALTDPTSSGDAIEVNEDTLAQSLAILDGQGRVVGAAFNETMPPIDVEPPFREDDLFLDTVVSVWEPVYGALGAQDAEALTALSERYPEFKEAYAQARSATTSCLPAPTIFRKRTPSSSWPRARSAAGRSDMNMWSPRLPTSGRGRPSRPWAGCAYTSVRSRLSRPFPRATSRSKTSRRARTGSSRTRTAEACST
jgi:hypothetical protein